ncbi:energy transducer TonB [Niastella sp. OAS944]|uniref:energy transducer TonB n=1 Tax=Niastella sp. OAS944 TaxID=2664089 RepID=UPI00347E805E|nr:protein TonB [Chitinophagaceae bacterium OAS944]
MKQYLLILSLLFICILFLNKSAAAQDSAATKAKIDTVKDDWEKGFIRQRFEGFFKGGDSAWQKYIDENLVYPQDAKSKKIEGVVTVEFIVGVDGTITEAKALNGPEELRQSAVDVVMRSPKWWPRIQSGRQVKTLKKCDIVFKLDKE